MGERLVIGVMTGTSLDGVDCAAIRVEGEALAMRARHESGISGGLGPARGPLREAMLAGVIDVERFLAARLAYSEAVADSVELLVREVGQTPALVAVHGQTVFHRPPLSWQVLDPWVVARRVGCAVVHDLRGADLASGGEGAPITPLADWVLFRSAEADRAIVNLGGFCNVTVLRRGVEAASVEGFDVCACNHVMDAAARAALGAPVDRGGEAALRGEADARAGEELGEVLRVQRSGRRSLGSGDEACSVVEEWRGRLGPEDLLATAAEVVGRTIGEAIADRAGGAVAHVAGGGAHNAALVGAIGRALGGDRGGGAPVRGLDALGVPGAYREAACMGVLGALAADGVGVTVPGVTGAREPLPLGGSWVNARPMPGGTEGGA